jgi:AraC-like DNA-binding protein
VNMSRSTVSIWHHTDDFQEALGCLGAHSISLTQRGQLRVRMVNLALEHLRLVTVEENLPRIAFIRVPDNTVLLSFLLSGQTVPLWAGHKILADEIIVVRGGESLHTQTGGAIHWAAIQYPLQEFMRLRRAVTGETSKLPGAISVWRPPTSARNTLLQLIVAAVRAAQTRWVALTTEQAAHGLEQQLIHCAFRCLTGSPVIVEAPAVHRGRKLASRFEALLQGDKEGKLRAANLAEALGVSVRMLRSNCKLHLGVGPMRYVHLRRMQSAHRALRSARSRALRVSDLALRHGFHSPGRFAKAYRELFGELPSWTLRGGGLRNRRTDLAIRGSGKRVVN